MRRNITRKDDTLRPISITHQIATARFIAVRMHAYTYYRMHAAEDYAKPCMKAAPYKASEKQFFVHKKSAGMYPLTGPDYWTELFSLFGQVQCLCYSL